MKAVIVFYDTLNRRYLHSYNPSSPCITPNFDKLSKCSVTFENSYAGSLPCIPARRELHTGRYNFLHREWGPLEPFDDSMPELLKNNGIYTHLVSDHVHYWEDGGGDYHTRYSSWEIIRGQEGDHWKGQLEDPKIPDVVMVPNAQTGKGVSSLWRYDWVNREYIHNLNDWPQMQVFNKGLEFLEKNHDQDDWLLQIESFDPHEPFFTPEEFLKLYPENYEGNFFDWPRGKSTQTKEEIEHCRRQYMALLTMCDYNLGRVLSIFDRYNLWTDTMLIVGTDHGFLLGEHEYWGKNQMPYYNEIANTPLFIWDPRYGIKGERRSALVQMIDWAPTILNYFNIPIPINVEGHDLSETIMHDTRVRDYALFGTFSGHVNITDGRYVYMRAAEKGRENEIYNYTLTPMHMTKPYSVEELRGAELFGPFKFTKGCKVLKIKSKDKYNVNRFGNLLFDLKTDPLELSPIKNEKEEQRLIHAMRQIMEENDSPIEQYYRLGINE